MSGKSLNFRIQKIQKTKFCQLLIFGFLLYSKYDCQQLVDSSYCNEGCSQCQSLSPNLNNYSCIQCKQNFKLDVSTNKCIFQLCNLNLYLQISQPDILKNNQCVALCQNSYFGNKFTNMCEKLEQCSTLFTSSNQLFTKTQIIEAQQLSESTFIVLYKGVSTLIDINSGRIQKTVNIDDDIMLVNVIKGNTFLFDQSNKIFKWNLNFEEKQYIQDVAQITKISFSTRNNFIEIGQRYVCAMIVDQENNQIQFWIIFDMLMQGIIDTNDTNNTQFQLIQEDSQLKIINNILIKQQGTSISIQLINFKEKLLIEQICIINKINQSDLTDMYDENDNILVIKINKKQILYINKELQVCKYLEIKEIKDNIQSFKMQQLNNNNNQLLLIIKENNLIYVYNFNTNAIQSLNINMVEQEFILDYQITYLQIKYPEIIILTNFNNFYTYLIDTQNNLIQFEKNELFMINILYIYKIKPLNQSYSSQLGILLSSLENLTILKRNSTNQKIEQISLVNYQMPFPSQFGKVKKIIVLEINSYLVLCTENGFIQIFDISSGLEAHLIKTININTDQCIDIQSMQSEKILAVLSTKVIVINLFSCIQEIQLKINFDQSITPLISVNGQYTSFSINGCISLYQNTKFNKVFENCDNVLQDSILKITLSQNLVLYLFSKTAIVQVQIDLQYQKLKILYIFSSQKQMPINCYESINITINDSLENEFYIDEILVFDQSQTLIILNANLAITHSLVIPYIKSPNMIKRAVNDSSFYVLIESFIEGDLQQFIVLAFIKSISLEIVWKFQSYSYSPIIQSPIKFTNENGIDQYLIRQFLILNTFNVIIESIIQMPKQKYYNQGNTFIYMYGISNVYTILDSQCSKSIIYVGSERGELAQYYKNNNIYQVIEISKYFKNQEDEINQFVNFQIMEKYFILIKSYVLVFNVFTDEYDDTIEFGTQNIQNAKISIIEKSNLFVFSSNNLLFLRNYETKQKYIDYYYRKQLIINEWLFDQKDGLFYVYGQGFNSLDTQLELKNEIISKDYTLEKCLINSNSYICKQNSNILRIIDKANLNNQQTVQIKGFSSPSSFKMNIDTKYSLLYLIENYVQVYTLQGTFSTFFQLSFINLLSIDFQDDYLIVSSFSNCAIFDRKTYTYITDFYVSFTIIKQMYVSRIQSIIFFLNSPQFSQIFVFDIPSKSMLGKITSLYPNNDIGSVVDFIYDGESTLVAFLDEFGNLQNNMLFLSYELVNNIKFFEITERKEKTLGFTIDFSTNEIHAYSNKTLYKANYAQFQDNFLYSLSQNKRIFQVIKSFDSNNKKLSLQYLLISENNTIFKYDNYQIIFQKIYNEEIIDLHYLSKYQQVIIAFSDHLKVYNNYQYDIYYNWNVYKKTELLLFEKFVDDDIFITFNKQIVHYDFKNMKILQSFQLELKSKLTSHLLLSSNEYIVFGFQNGQIIIYNKNKFKMTYIQNQSFIEYQNKPVKFILEIDKSNLFISTNEGQIIQYDIISDQIINKYELTKLIKTNKKGILFLSDLKYDNVNKRFLFIFIGQHGGYIWGLNQGKILSHFSGGNIQKNTITLTNKYVIISSAFQLNFYSLSGDSKFIGMIYGNPWYDQIQNFKIVDNEIVIICYFNKIQIYYIYDEKIQLIENQLIDSPFILEYAYSKEQKYINVAFLSKQGISQLMINAYYFINDNLKACYSLINSNETQNIQIQVQMIQQRKAYKMIYGEKKLIPSNDSLIFLNVDIESEYISFLSSILKKQNVQQQIVLSPINVANNDYILQENSFKQLEQQKFYLKNFYFYINEKQTSNNFNIISFNKITEFVIWQNITFIQNQNIQGIQINFINQTEVILFDIRLTSLIFGFKEYKSEQTKSLLYFENVERVLIFNLTIENNHLNNSDYSSILFMKSVKNVFLQNVFIRNNKGKINIFRFDLVNQIRLNNFQIYSNQNLDENSLIKFIILICKGCKEILASEIEFSQNEQIQLIQTVNQYELDEEIKTYSKDSINLTNITINQNNLNFGQIISITQSYVNFTNLTQTLNQRNIKINDAKNITIEKSLFSNNSAFNGGAISIYNLKQLLTLKQTRIIQNTAIGNGGGIYLENIQTQNIEFDLDCQIQKNKALIGGGVRILNKYQKQIIPLQYPFESVVEQNNAELYGDNICTFLQNILILNGYEDQVQASNNTYINLTNYEFNYKFIDINQQIQGQTGFMGYVQIQDFKSGGNLYLHIYFIDEDQKKLQFDQDKFKLQQYPEDIIEEIESLSIIFTQSNGNENSIILTGQTILNHHLYNQDCNCFQIKQLTISSMPSITKYLYIQFFTNKYINQTTQILVSIEFRKCHLGEVIQVTSSNIQTCYFCPDGTYSLIDPNSIQTKNQVQIGCKKCPDSALNCIGSIITLRNGYWRKDNNTDEILSCNSYINSCKAEDPESSEQGCVKGFVGPLCEQCDLEGIVWGRQYIPSFDGNQCSECSNLVLQYTFFILQGIGILLFLIFNSFKSQQSFEYSQTCFYLRKLQFLPISKIQLSSLTTSFIKIIISYLQFSSLLTSQASFLPRQFNIMPNLFGSSNKMITQSITCIIPRKLTKLFGKSFVLCFINSFVPLLYILFGIIIFQFFKNNLSPTRFQQKYIIFTQLNVIYMFFLLDTVQFFTAVLTCRQIGSQSYNTIDLLEECNQEKYIMILKPFSGSILILWTIFPLIILFFLRKQKHSLNDCSKKFKYGYFYVELKNQYYYWEFVRILLKLLIVIVNTLLKQIIILMFAQYIKLVTSIKPFLSTELQQMEILSMQLIIAKILLQTSKELIVQGKIMFEIFIFLTDFSFIFYFVLNTSKYIINNSYSLLGKMLQFILKKICSEKRYKKITKIKQTQFITYMRWKMIKNNLENIIKSKANYNMTVLSNQIYQQQCQIISQRNLSGINLLSHGSGTIKRQVHSKYSLMFRQNSIQSKDYNDSISLNQTHVI